MTAPPTKTAWTALLAPTIARLQEQVDAGRVAKLEPDAALALIQLLNVMSAYLDMTRLKPVKELSDDQAQSEPESGPH